MVLNPVDLAIISLHHISIGIEWDDTPLMRDKYHRAEWEDIVGPARHYYGIMTSLTTISRHDYELKSDLVRTTLLINLYECEWVVRIG